MDENITEESAGRRPGRRAVIKGAAAGAVGVWTLPVVTSFTSPAAAAGSAGNPHPECVGATCGNFKNCSSTDPNCLCFSTSDGGGVCFRGDTFCVDFAQCVTSSDCPTGSVCVVNSCCGYGICVTPEHLAACPPSTEEPVEEGFGLFSVPQRNEIPGTAGFAG